jgi:hypothetical protein
MATGAKEEAVVAECKPCLLRGYQNGRLNGADPADHSVQWCSCSSSYHTTLFSRWLQGTLAARSSMMRNLLSTAGRRFSRPPIPGCQRTIVQFQRPGPPPLPLEDQREFEESVRKAQGTLWDKDPISALHPDARQPLVPEFDGDVNPLTGERGGPKREPVRRWTEEGDWSYKGRVSDF